MWLCAQMTKGGKNSVTIEHILFYISGSSLSALGYHLCIHNETRWASFLVMHKVPYTVSKPCGGWLLWKTCNATLYKMVPKTENRTVIMQVTKCCNGYVQAGRYCAIRKCLLITYYSVFFPTL